MTIPSGSLFVQKTNSTPVRRRRPGNLPEKPPGRQQDGQTCVVWFFRTFGENGKIGTFSRRKQASSYETIFLVDRRCCDSEARERSFHQKCGRTRCIPFREATPESAPSFS